jgi:hypothetical protein
MPDLSVKQLKRAQRLVNDDEGFRHLGNVDVDMAVKIAQQRYLISFGGFKCNLIRKINATEQQAVDFVVEMTSAQWDRYMLACRTPGGSNLAQFDSEESVVQASDPRKMLEFLRYHTSIQAFFEAYAQPELSLA